jgi:hypothetical protein
VPVVHEVFTIEGSPSPEKANAKQHIIARCKPIDSKPIDTAPDEGANCPNWTDRTAAAMLGAGSASSMARGRIDKESDASHVRKKSLPTPFDADGSVQPF